MAQLQAILKYQETDAKLYKLERELAGCEERKEYMKYKKFLETAPEKLDSLEVKAATLKAEAAELTKKYEQMEETLQYFDNVDELLTSGADISFYQKKAQSKVEQLRKFKADLTALIASIKETDSEYKKLKKQVIAAQNQYKEAAEKYKAVKASKDGEMKEIEKELSLIVKEVPERMLEVYQMKRKERVFPVVGEIVGTRCPFCSMEPPLAARNKLTGGGTIECDNCHRIIFSKE
ncbi:MAG: hypothetical protein IJV83_01715 [Clostridia bacterium]|nr:hypothetical protein [Clostridia bacterium]